MSERERLQEARRWLGDFDPMYVACHLGLPYAAVLRVAGEGVAAPAYCEGMPHYAFQRAGCGCTWDTISGSRRCGRPPRPSSEHQGSR